MTARYYQLGARYDSDAWIVRGCWLRIRIYLSAHPALADWGLSSAAWLRPTSLRGPQVYAEALVIMSVLSEASQFHFYTSLIASLVARIQGSEEYLSLVRTPGCLLDLHWLNADVSVSLNCPSQHLADWTPVDFS